MQNGELRLLNNIWYGFSHFTTLDANPTTGIIRYTSGGDDTTCADLISHLNANNNLIADPMLNGISRTPNGQLDPRPSSSNSIITSGLATYPTDSFFTTENYKGAFDPNSPTFWLNAWTALDEYGYLATSTSIKPMANQIGIEIHVFPNPANNNINVKLNTDLDQSISIMLFDVLGHLVVQQDNIYLHSGNEKVISINIEGLSSGMYILKAKSTSGTNSHNIIIR